MRTMASMVPFAFMWDDHDFGPDNSDKNASGKPASLLVYRERIPHYPVGTGPIQQAFSVGKVRFILTDLRSEREPNSTTDSASKTMMGTEQKAWFKSELLAAKSTHDLTIWVSTVPYVAAATSGGDHWGGFTTERTEIADYLKSNGISNIFIISGDAHCLAANNGLNADYATGGGMPIPEALASPLDGDDTKPKGGPWSEGTYMPPLGENVYGLVEISYPTNKVKLTYRGIDNKQVERLTYAKEWSLP
jgi:alkaline phosphatase D